MSLCRSRGQDQGILFNLTHATVALAFYPGIHWQIVEQMLFYFTVVEMPLLSRNASAHARKSGGCLTNDHNQMTKPLLQMLLP